MSSTLAFVAVCNGGVINPTTPTALSPGAGLVSATAADSAQASANICHLRSAQGDYVPLSVNDNALSGHFSHGDGRVGDPVPGMPTKYFGLACELLDMVNILVNGSFELGPPIPTQDINIPGGSTAIDGWLVTGIVIDYVGPPWDVSNGVRAIDLDGNGATGGIQQTFATVAGSTYVVSFDLSGNPGGPPTVKQVRVAADGVTQDYQFDSSGQSVSALNWQSITFSFVASGTSATLSFTSLSPSGNSYGALIDNVSVLGAPGS